MSNETINTEQAILQAAEEEFLAKGYALSKTTEIAKAAGVTHAMLHYYFRTKENLFNKVFEEKAQLLIHSFTHITNEDLPFEEKVIKGISTHFDFIVANPRLPFFVLSEILANPSRLDLCHRLFQPIITTTLGKLGQILQEEIAKGNIRSIEPIDFILSIVSLNVFTFIAQPIIGLVQPFDAEFLERRKKENIEIILGRLKP